MSRTRSARSKQWIERTESRSKLERTVIDVLLIMLVSIAAYTDIKRGKVYNTLTFPAVALGLILNTLLGGADGLSDSVRASLMAFALLIIPVAMKGVGAGDLKLLVAVGALGGVQFLILAFFWSALIAGAASVVVLAARRPAFASLPFAPVWALGAVRSFPYAVAMAIGCVITVLTR